MSHRKIPAPHGERIRACREAMTERGLAAYLITDTQDVHYLSGFTGEDSALLITPRSVHMISDARFEEAIREELPWARKHLRRGTLPQEIGAVCRRLGLPEVGMQPEAVTLATDAIVRRESRPTRWRKAPNILAERRIHKDAGEVRAIVAAIRVAQDAFETARRALRVGQTELEIAARLEFEMRVRGARSAAFPTICAEGANASHPHAHSGGRRIRKGSALLVDWGATVGFYRSDLTRMLFVDKIRPQLGEIYRIVLDAQLAAIDAIRPGARMCDVDRVARQLIRQAGYKKEFSHGLGHGLGLAVHEPPSLSWRSEAPLASGMVVTVEPGIYLPGVGGVRIEDDVLVTDRGCRVLSDLDKSLAGAVV